MLEIQWEIFPHLVDTETDIFKEKVGNTWWGRKLSLL